MSVLYFANDLSGPSVLWMRRMLRLLGEDVATLVTEVDPGTEYRKLYEVVVVYDSFWSWWFRLGRRLGLTPSPRKTAKALGTFAGAFRSDSVKVGLMHYLTNGVEYDRVWDKIRKPVFIHCHGYDVTWDLRWYDDPGRPAHYPDYIDRVRGFPKHVSFIANSKATMRRLFDIGIPEHRVHLKYLGVPIPSSPPTRHSPNVDHGELNILYLGRLVDFKGPELVIRAFDLACQQGLEARLIIAGDGPLRQECESARERSSSRERIELLGAVDSQTGVRLRRSADIFTAHSRTGLITRQEEAFGVSFVEAMADGLPVVSGSSGSLPEIVDNGVEGILFEPGDVEAHAEAFLRLAGDPEMRSRMGENGWRRARRDFSLERERQTLHRILGLSEDSSAGPAAMGAATKAPGR